jgi:hypothetical protein
VALAATCRPVAVTITVTNTTGHGFAVITPEQQSLELAGQPGNEAPTYIVHYMCDQFWVDSFGADRLPEMQAEAMSLATDLLEWAEGWGSTHA